MNPVLCYVRARLQRRLFVWFGATILLTGLAVMFVVGAMEHVHGGFRAETQRMSHFASSRFERVWEAPADRDELARAVSRDFDASVTLHDPTGAAIASFGPPCVQTKPFHVPVVRNGALIGSVAVCADRYRVTRVGVLVPLLVTGLLLWTGSGIIARRLSRPMAELHRVAEELGAGNLGARVRLGHHHRFGEAQSLAMTINTMAARLERQVSEQRELLAAVSHELRTPLSRIRLITEMARADGMADKPFQDLDREVVEMDALVGDLLASSRLDFQVASRRKLDAVQVAAQAVERASLSPSVLEVEGGGTDHAPGAALSVNADPTLLGRALSNVLENAKKHGQGVVSFRIQRRGAHVAFVVEDAGSGFPEGEEARVFEPFYRRSEKGSLGLGLSLVRRIAAAHGGRAFAGNRAGGGAQVGIELPAV